MAQAKPKEQPFVFTISRIFNAPRDRVWKAWTDAKQAKEWFGPKGCSVRYKTHELKAGGLSHYCIAYEGNDMWGKWTYKEVKAPERVVAIVAFTDEEGETLLPHPGMPGWPREVLSTVRFIPKGDKTEVAVEWQAHNATDAERHTFAEGESAMQQGWGGSLDQLEAYLAGQK